ncbi:LAFA_0E12486g1_1 [Lachancea sp. 'fantastica']|nr:LAFA_0E12486g1_1 [Lachancea sp. 'fantastica']
MSNFFRDNSRGFKPRSNIFTKLRNKDSDLDSDVSSDNAVSTIDWSTPGPKRSKLDMQDSRFLTTDTNLSVLTESTPLSKNRLQKADLETRNVGIAMDSANGFTKNIAAGTKGVVIEKGTSRFNATSSNDVLLEAFTNTQKICSSLKLELQQVKSENQHQSDTIGAYKSEIGKLEGKMVEHRQLLLALETKSSELRSKKQTTDEHLAVLKSDYDDLVERVRHQKEDSIALRTHLDDISLQHKLCGSTLSEKSEELERLKAEVNAEKVKSQNLEQELKKTRECSSRISEEILKQMDTSIIKGVSSLERSMKTEFNNVSRSAPDFQHFCKTLQFSVTQQLKEESKKIGDKVQSDLREELCSLEDTLKKRFDANLAEAPRPVDLNSIEDGLTRISGELQELKRTESRNCSEELVVMLHDSVKDVKASLSVIRSKLQEYSDNVDHAGSYECKIDSLHERLQATALQKSEAVSLIKSRDIEIEDLNNQILGKSDRISKLEDEEKHLRVSLTQNEHLLEVKNKQMLMVTEELSMNRADCENKLAAQNEVIRLMKSQCDSLQSDIDGCNRARSDVDRENLEIKANAKQTNEQVQNLNVEIIQLKARELELDEENRNLKNMIEQFNLDVRENSNQVREYKRRVAELESENTSRASDVLENQDQIALLEQRLQSARKAVDILKKEKCELMRPDGKIMKKAPQKQQHRGHHSGAPQRPPVSLVAAELPVNQQKPRQDDMFELSSSSNDGLEMTYPSPIATKMSKPRKVLLSEDTGSPEPGPQRGRKKRKVRV